jgi:hypothetical protein
MGRVFLLSSQAFLMIRSLILLIFCAPFVAACGSPAAAHDWMFLPSSYSHDWQTGHRVTQFAPIPPVIVYQRPDYLRSGYRHHRSTINAGGSQDNYHVVDQYGGEVRPYGEWLYPFRPYSVPYDAWGPPFGGVNGEIYRDEFRRGFPLRGRRGVDEFGAVDALDPAAAAPDAVDFDRRRSRLDAYERVRERYNGLFDGRNIPGDDEHYLDHPSRLDEMNDREFFSRPNARGR